MKLYVSNIAESYKDTIIGHLVNLVIAQRAYVVDKENQPLPMVLYCSVMMYTYCSYLGFIPIKHNHEGRDIHNEIFNNIPHFIKNLLRINCLQYGFVMYNYKLIL